LQNAAAYLNPKRPINAAHVAPVLLLPVLNIIAMRLLVGLITPVPKFVAAAFLIP
jgi:hypothetical protein